MFSDIKPVTEQENLKGISPTERLSSLYDSGLYSDCSFIVEGTEIQAHRLVLALASPYMERMFLGPEPPTEPVEVPYSLRVMQLVLRHCYLQDIDIENIDEAQDVIEAANYFEIKDLVELCCTSKYNARTSHITLLISNNSRSRSRIP